MSSGMASSLLDCRALCSRRAALREGARERHIAGDRNVLGPRLRIEAGLGQQSLRGVMAFCNARLMTAPEAYIHYTPEVFGDDGSISNESTETFLRNYMSEFRDHIVRVLTVLPR